MDAEYRELELVKLSTSLPESATKVEELATEPEPAPEPVPDVAKPEPVPEPEPVVEVFEVEAPPPIVVTEPEDDVVLIKP